MEEYKQAIRESKIARLPYKSLLGVSLTEFINLNKSLSDDDLLHLILFKIKEKRNLIQDWSFTDIVKNVKISLSARRSEINYYSGFSCPNCNYINKWNVQNGDHCDNCQMILKGG